jgi:hypothetical protein
MATWNDAFNQQPAGSDDPAEGDDRIRELKVEIDGRLNQEHVFHDTTTTSQSVHRAGSARVYYQAAEPTLRPDGVTALGASDSGRLWVDSDDVTLKKIYNGTAWVALDLSVDDISCGDITLSGGGDLTLLGGDISAVGDLSITGDTTLGGTCDITGNSTIGGTLEVTGAITASAGWTVVACASDVDGDANDLEVVTVLQSVTDTFHLLKPVTAFIKGYTSGGIGGGTGDLDVYFDSSWEEVVSLDVAAGTSSVLMLNPGYYRLSGDAFGGGTLSLVIAGVFGADALDTVAEIVTEV